MNIHKKEIAQALKENNWSFFNSLLYKICSKHFEHKNVDVVASGIWPGMTATQKTTIKAFMKAIDAVAKEVTPGEIIGEFLD